MTEGEESGMNGLGAFGDASPIVPDFQVASTHGVMGHRSYYTHTHIHIHTDTCTHTHAHTHTHTEFCHIIKNIHQDRRFWGLYLNIQVDHRKWTLQYAEFLTC